MALRDTGKQRASRIPLDYYKQRDGFLRGKRAVAGVAAIAAVLWWGSGVLFSTTAPARYTHGPLAAVHATWDLECAACHVSFRPIHSEAAFASFCDSSHVADQKCQACHLAEGAQHHPVKEQALNLEVASCASCHQDHQGRDTDLTRIADHHCTSCHQDLPAHGVEGVTEFKKGKHPEFKLPERDPVSLKFSHRRHLAPGLAIDDEKQAMKFVGTDGRQFANDGERKRYRLDQESRSGTTPTDDDLVQLDCASCHRLDRGDAKKSTALPAGRDSLLTSPQATNRAEAHPRTPGDLMLPVTFEQHCKACHQQELAFGGPETLTPIPHGLKTPELRPWLANDLSKQVLHGNSDFWELPLPRRPLPNDPAVQEAAKIREQFDKRLEKHEGDIRGRCSYCHSFPEPDRADPEVALDVTPTRITQVWFDQARFDHAAHRALSCEECHGDPKKSQDSSDVLIPGMATCARCHAERSFTAGVATGGARSDCVECHRYHGGEHPSVGVGSAARGIADESRFSISDFLTGNRKPKPDAP